MPASIDSNDILMSDIIFIGLLNRILFLLTNRAKPPRSDLVFQTEMDLWLTDKILMIMLLMGNFKRKLRKKVAVAVSRGFDNWGLYSR